MRKREIVSYIITCICITAVILLWLTVGYKDRTILEQVAEIDNLQEIKLVDTFQDNAPEIMEETIDENLELEIKLIAQEVALTNKVSELAAVEYYITVLQEIMDANNVIYPIVIYKEIESEITFEELYKALFMESEND